MFRYLWFATLVDQFMRRGYQSRIMTPRAALEAGSSYLVIGRPITKADDPLCALREILRQIGGMV